MQSNKMRVTYSVIYEDYTRLAITSDLTKQGYEKLLEVLTGSVKRDLIRWYTIDHISILHRVHVLLVWNDNSETTHDWYMTYKEYKEYVKYLKDCLKTGELKDYMCYLTDKADKSEGSSLS